MEAKKKNKKKSKQKNTLAELLPGPSPPPPPVSTVASNVVAQNPFDDPMPSNSVQSKPSGPSSMISTQAGTMPPTMQHGGGMNPHSKVYPPNQPMVFNPSNPSAPPIYPCGVCHKEVHENDQAVLCESGCNFWFHRMCAGLTHDAFSMLKVEVYAEWVCDRCLNTKNIPLVKLKP
ncbi:protein pygopus [Plakobranchus ocellatus]|uniref:Protein pygopus n=1 Tax=Plakobranchus ocellatus TaxID=259542 RepID=A0AAV4BLG4_9GAST|nr:protein pygopus [Plakobranchus ocellatus]